MLKEKKNINIKYLHPTRLIESETKRPYLLIYSLNIPYYKNN